MVSTTTSAAAPTATELPRPPAPKTPNAAVAWDAPYAKRAMCVHSFQLLQLPAREMAGVCACEYVSVWANLEAKLDVPKAYNVAILNLSILMRHQWRAIDTGAIKGIQIFDIEVSAATGEARMAARDRLRGIERQQIDIGAEA